MNFRSRQDFIQDRVDGKLGLTPLNKLRLRLRHDEWDVRLLAAKDWEAMFEDELTPVVRYGRLT